jgi:Aspartyl/Asparaginyl beta-hydroxylase
MKKPDRKDFPLFQKMPIKVDLELLKKDLLVLETRNNWLDINPETKYYESLIKNREHLLEKFADKDGKFTTYNQIVLTEFDIDTYVGISEQTVEEIVDKSYNQKYSRYKKDVLEIVAEQNEKNYGKFRSLISDLEYTKQLLSGFKNKVTRARFARLKPGGDIKPHIDNNVGYGVRYHIALETNDDCYIAIRRNPKQDFEYFHIPADGYLYYINVGFEHFAINNGKTDRIHLVIGVNGLDDLLPFKKQSRYD